MSDILLIEKLRAALAEQHAWHLAQAEPEEAGTILAYYQESSMFDRTLAALEMAEAEIARRCGRTTS